jgi:hypothetical protein
MRVLVSIVTYGQARLLILKVLTGAWISNSNVVISASLRVSFTSFL